MDKDDDCQVVVAEMFFTGRDNEMQHDLQGMLVFHK